MQMRDYDLSKKWTVNSAIYHAIRGMLFANNKMEFRVGNLLDGSEELSGDLDSPNIFNKEPKLFIYSIIRDP